MDLHPSEQIIYDGHPSWRSIKAFYASGALISLLVGLIFWFATSEATGVAIFVAGVAITVVAGLVKRVFTTFTITTDRLRIQRGILAKRVQQTRIDRVQNVNTRQSPIDRLFRVGAVDFDTAGSDDSDFTFDGVNNPDQVVQAVDRAQRLHVERARAEGARAEPDTGL